MVLLAHGSRLALLLPNLRVSIRSTTMSDPVQQSERERQGKTRPDLLPALSSFYYWSGLLSSAHWLLFGVNTGHIFQAERGSDKVMRWETAMYKAVPPALFSVLVHCMG